VASETVVSGASRSRITWSAERVLAVRMANQALTPTGLPSAAAAAAHVVGVQAQDIPATHLALRSRCPSLTSAGSVRAINSGEVVRTWLMRGTLHAAAAADIRWLGALFEMSQLARFRTHRAEHGLTPALLDRAADVLPEILRGRQLTRKQLVAALADAGISIRTPGQAAAHFTVWGAAIGLLCRGPDQGRTATFALLDDWVPIEATVPSDVLGDRPSDEPAAYRRLIHRYLSAFGPATLADFVAWSGLPVGKARPALADLTEELGGELRRIDVDDRNLFAVGDRRPVAAGTLRLLAGWDTYLLGYRDRTELLDAEQTDAVIAGGGWFHPSIAADGRIVGTWRVQPGTEQCRVRVAFGERPSSRLLASVEAEAARVARFYGGRLDFQVVDGFPRNQR
jgi:hypothetical protein